MRRTSDRSSERRSGAKFERVERQRPPLPPQYEPRYYPYDYDWWRYYDRLPPREREVVVVREPEVVVVHEPEVIVVEKPVPVPAPEPPPQPEPPAEPSNPPERPAPEDVLAPPVPSEPAEALEPIEVVPSRPFVFREGTAERAFEEIGRGWQESSIELIEAHVLPERQIRIFQDGKFSHKLTGEDFLQLTADAMDRLQTGEFSLEVVNRIRDKVFGTGMHRYTGPDGRKHRAFVTYTLKKIGGKWIIVEAGFARLQTPG